MDEKIKARLTNVDTWKRGLFMVLFSIFSGVAKFIVSLTAIFQFLTLLFKGEVNQAVIPFGQNLSTYIYQITLFLTFKTNKMPFPFVAFPDGTPASMDNGLNTENVATAQTRTKSDEETVDVTDDDIKK
jgi:hypothetical protein